MRATDRPTALVILDSMRGLRPLATPAGVVNGNSLSRYAPGCGSRKQVNVSAKIWNVLSQFP